MNRSICNTPRRFLSQQVCVIVLILRSRRHFLLDTIKFVVFFAVLIVIGVVEEKEKRESTYISALECLNVFIMANISAENVIFCPTYI